MNSWLDWGGILGGKERKSGCGVKESERDGCKNGTRRRRRRTGLEIVAEETGERVEDSREDIGRDEKRWERRACWIGCTSLVF
jgi:hypothetical protein